MVNSQSMVLCFLLALEILIRLSLLLNRTYYFNKLITASSYIYTQVYKRLKLWTHNNKQHNINNYKFFIFLFSFSSQQHSQTQHWLNNVCFGVANGFLAPPSHSFDSFRNDFVWSMSNEHWWNFIFLHFLVLCETLYRYEWVSLSSCARF